MGKYLTSSEAAELLRTSLGVLANQMRIPKHSNHLFRLIPTGHSDPTQPAFRP